MGTATVGTTRRSEVTSFRAVQRQLAAGLIGATPADPNGPTLETQRIATGEPPRLARARVLEGEDIERRAVSGAPSVGFSAFLDGIQATRVLFYDTAVPIVHGSVSAVVRIRDDRRLTTWEHTVAARVYAPRAYLSPPTNELLNTFAIDVFDSTPRRSDGTVDEDARHPLALADVAVHAVQAHRETLEQGLAELWCDRARGSVLYVDGGISASARLASELCAVGVVKSHRILYGDPAAVRTILSLGEGERSSVFAITPPNRWRSTVASWYLRVRAAAGRDPLWGLVRVEVAPPDADDTHAIGARADQVSRWVLAEAAPLSLPDSRWDTMAYGIRDCEQFLRSIT